MFVKRRLARCDNDLARLQLLAKIPAMKPHNPAHPRIVTNEGFEKWSAVIILVVNGLDQADKTDRPIGFNLTDLGRLRHEIPITRVILQQIPHRLDAQLGKRLGPGRPHPFEITNGRRHIKLSS